MTAFTPLERRALDAILDELSDARPVVEQQLSHAVVLSRENTGGGFFTDFEVAAVADSLDPMTSPLGQNVWLAIDGLEYGLGMIVHQKGGRINLLEGYSVGGEDTSELDLAHVRFAIVNEPGPLPVEGS